MATKIVSEPAKEPVTLAEAKAHCRITVSDDDDLVTALIVAARQSAEIHTNRQFITATWKLTLDSFPGGQQYATDVLVGASDIIRIPYPPLQTITHVKYYDTGGTQQTLSADDYQVDNQSEPGRIYPGVDDLWPFTELNRINAVEIQYDAGYGDDEEDVPQAIKQAIFLTVGHWYEHREEVLVGVTPSKLPFAAESLLINYSVPEV